MKKQIEICDECQEENEWLQICEICNKDFCDNCLHDHFYQEHGEDLIKLWKEYKK